MNWVQGLQLVLLIVTFSFFGGMVRALLFDEFIERSERIAFIIVGALMCIAHLVLLIVAE